MAALDGEMLEAGVDLSKIHELTARKEGLQATLDARYLASPNSYIEPLAPRS